MSYKAPLFLFNAHLETIYPSLIRRVPLQLYTRERITTPDNDFLDLDWLTQGSTRLIIISHGLEGNSQRPYIKGLARAAFLKGFDVLAWNFRGCSEEMNRQLRFYHSGATEDLDTIVQHAQKNNYTEIYLMGFSLGGNLTLKYLGERNANPVLRKAVVFSVPLELSTSCQKISEPSNWIYSQRFLKSLRNKVVQKSTAFKELDTRNIETIRTLREFDDRYTAPLHGFRNAADYYERCSSLYFVKNIGVPTLIINAQNDPFLSADCYPVEKLKDHSFVRFENPGRGGHVGFAQFNKNGLYWSEERALNFICNGDR